MGRTCESHVGEILNAFNFTDVATGLRVAGMQVFNFRMKLKDVGYKFIYIIIAYEAGKYHQLVFAIPYQR
jgi:hypothetical protein